MKFAILQPIFRRFIDPAALEILQHLSQEPISLHRCRRADWPAIEQELKQHLPWHDLALDEVDQDLMQHIDLLAWGKFASITTWEAYAAQELAISLGSLHQRLERLHQWRGMQWDDRQGSLMFLS